MKLTNVFNLMVLGLALTVGATGCKKKPTPITTLPNGQRVGPGDGHISGISDIPPAPPTTINDGTAGTFIPPSIPKDQTTGTIALGPGHTGWNENPDMFKSSTVHFDFDKSSVRSSEQHKVTEVATYLKNNPQAAVRVEGNCDERGTEEYNRSLGERRALAVRESLVAAGVDPSRVDTVSFGEDKPVDHGQNEAAFAANRRADFVLLTPP